VPYRKVVMRTGRSGEEGQLFSLAKSVFGERRAWDDARALSALASDMVFVAELGGVPAGYVAVRREQSCICIEQLAVHPAHEEEAIEEQLVAWAEGYAIAEGALALQVVVQGDDDVAVGFYRQHGFAQVAPDRLELVLPQT
jgi:ribosomal protein S18 acetylase RimI-like enzyme